MDRVYPLTVTTPDGTLEASPQSTTWPLEDARLLYIDLIIPAGHNGLTGLRVEYNGTQIVPWGDVSYIIANNDRIRFPVNGEITRTGLVIITYNTDVFDHSHYLYAAIQDLPEPTAVVNISGQVIATAQEEIPFEIPTEYDIGM